jgi:hypothetical protein
MVAQLSDDRIEPSEGRCLTNVLVKHHVVGTSPPAIPLDTLRELRSIVDASVVERFNSLFGRLDGAAVYLTRSARKGQVLVADIVRYAYRHVPARIVKQLVLKCESACIDQDNLPPASPSPEKV